MKTNFPEFSTVTCLSWKPILKEDREKELLLDSLRFLVNDGRIALNGFVIMTNHFHVIWKMNESHNRPEVLRDLLKFTAQQMLKNFRNENSFFMQDLIVNARDRKHQVWERNSLHVPLWTTSVVLQKLNYIHLNPVRAGICKIQQEYKYSSANFYKTGDRSWGFLTRL